MARLSKAQPIDVYDDSKPLTTMPALLEPIDSVMIPHNKSRPELERQDSKYDSLASNSLCNDDDDPNFMTVNEDEDADADDERRESVITSTSISSLPESANLTDNEIPFSMHGPYTPPSIRPTFRRAESVRRMQMTSPTPFDRSPRRSVLSRSRPGTPRSNRSNVKVPKERKRIDEEEEEEDERRDHPLVLLHLTLLPVDLPWSAENMHDLLPASTQDNLQRLRAKVSENILQRGILIPHPREDYELLEERLLEALELRTERVTKCGHFRAHGSMSTISSGDGSVDSGHGSSLEGSDNEVCLTCYHRVKTARSGVGAGNQRWTVKVFAANGLMRAAAWAAAWPEMERVDVEIQPWISDESRKALDARAAEEEAAERMKAEEEALFAAPAGELEWIVDEEGPDMPSPERQQAFRTLEGSLAAGILARIATETGQQPMVSISESGIQPDHTPKGPSDLPPIYRPSEIPLTLLLRNYVFLLAQDTRNVAIFALTVIAVWLSLKSAFTSAPPSSITPTLELCPHTEATKSLFNATVDLFDPPNEISANTSQAESISADGSNVIQPTSPSDEPDQSTIPISAT